VPTLTLIAILLVARDDDGDGGSTPGRRTEGLAIAYKYPRSVVIVDELPKTTTGKILRR
jgi:acyl-CoA synthetase (AMP-forming)/AMP-acid ligase II